MGDRLLLLSPELILLAGSVVCAIVGLVNTPAIRRRVGFVAASFLAAALIATPLLATTERGVSADAILPGVGLYLKMVVASIGLLLVLTVGGLVDRSYERAVASGRATFDPLRTFGGEFHALMLLSLSGVMLICDARDLIWLFLALELTSLPTYVMVAMSRRSSLAGEAAMKYFFLGAMSSAIMLFGFAILYAATGTIVFSEMQLGGGAVPLVTQVGLLLAIFGLCYKIAAAPMHIYAPDVYQGAASGVTAFLAFVPKTAGMAGIILLLSIVGWHDGLPPLIEMSLWVVAVLTMVLGNIGALLQSSAKRMLGYSSIAHSGYMIIGVMAGPGLGLTAVLVYLFIYGISNTGAFATLACLSRRGGEVDSIEDLAGMQRKSPMAAAAFALCCASLLGLPPLLGFWGKLYLFIAGIQAGHLPLVLVAAVMSAVSAWYYLKLVGVAVLGGAKSESRGAVIRSPWPLGAAVIAGVCVLLGPLALGWVSTQAEEAAQCVEDVTLAKSPAIVEQE
ncbi:MAG: NADH-quinone oxidoreductase subunit N [Phycisphaerales bacterium]|nr:NADH-quinone oxidoreductase subunit N [Phycisphaerales bacterium]